MPLTASLLVSEAHAALIIDVARRIESAQTTQEDAYFLLGYARRIRQVLRDETVNNGVEWSATAADLRARAALLETKDPMYDALEAAATTLETAAAEADGYTLTSEEEEPMAWIPYVTKQALTTAETAAAFTSANKILIREQGAGSVAFRVAVTSGQTADGGAYLYVPIGAAFSVDQISLTGSLYLRTDTGTGTFTIHYWGQGS